MKKVFYIIWGFTPVAFILASLAIIGVIYPPPGSKNYHLDDANFNLAIQRIDSLPLFLEHCDKQNEDLQRHYMWIWEYSPNKTSYNRWPLDCKTIVNIECDFSNNDIYILSFEIKEEISNYIGYINKGGSLIKQLKVIHKFEQTVLNGLNYKSDTTLFQDGLNHAKRTFIEICAVWPLIALVSFLIYWLCYGNPFAKPEDPDTNI